MPLSIIILIIVAAVIFAALSVAKAALSSTKIGGSGDRYYLKKSIFSPAERSFLGVLDSLNPPDIRICAKVRLADIFGLKKGLPKGGAQSAFNRISAKHVDFLLVQQNDGMPLLGIELDDKSHEEDQRKSRDAFVDEVFREAGLPLLHVPARATYDPRELTRVIEEAFTKQNR